MAGTISGGSRFVVFSAGLGLLLLAAAAGPGATSDSVHAQEAAHPTIQSETGVASYYADRYHGKRTASGELFDMHALTAAHPTHPFGTRVKVTHLASRRWVIVRINDRGPFVKGRVIDLSLAAAEKLQMVQSGIAQVHVEPVPDEAR